MTLQSETSATMEDTWTPEAAIPDDLRTYIETVGDNPSPFARLHIFLQIIYRLKATKRTGWLNYGVQDAESISDHMYRMGIITMLTGETSLNRDRCTKLALVHDMAESLVGDITPADPIPKEVKHKRELDTMTYLRDLLRPFNARAADEIYELWNEYENVSSPEARFVKDVDKFELMVQTFDFEFRDKCEIDLSRLMSVRSQIKTKEVAEWADHVIEERLRLWEANNKGVPTWSRPNGN